MRWFHLLIIRQWAQGDWTDDTDQMLCILHSLLACHGQVQDVDIAKRIAHWLALHFRPFVPLYDGNTSNQEIIYQGFSWLS